MTRDRSIDLAKGVAILFVYVGHSILYHPIHMNGSVFVAMTAFIMSFNMPMFFIISGYLFALSKRSEGEQYVSKTRHLLIPYLFTMAIVIGMKLILPASMAANRSVDGGLMSMLRNALLEGGDRWFVYVLFIIFALLIPLRHSLGKKSIAIGLMAALAIVSYMGVMPKVFVLDDVCYYMIFFIAGYALKEYYSSIKTWALKYWYVVYLLWFVTYYVCVYVLYDLTITGRFVIPFFGSLGAMTIAFQLEKLKESNMVSRYVSYCGKYSLQFYLFTFCYPIIRTVIVSVLHVTNHYLIFLSPHPAVDNDDNNR